MNNFVSENHPFEKPPGSYPGFGRPLFGGGVVALAGAFLSLSLLSSCSKDEPQGTEVENEIGVGRLYLADGKPAPFATVRIYKVDAVPAPEGLRKWSFESEAADAVLITNTDGQGRFMTGSLANGEYNILSKLDDAYAYQDSLALGKDAGPIPPDTLLDPGVVRGYVGVQPQHDPRSVTVQLIGTNRFANVDSSGRFEFGDLGGGAYTVRLVTTEPEYTPTYTSFAAISGRETDLKDTLRLIFTGIPAVAGVKVEYDTAKGVATLRWNRARHALLQDYEVFRDYGLVDPTFPTHLTYSKDTVYADTLWQASPAGVSMENGFRYPFDDSTRRDFTWRVRARLKTQAIGPLLLSASMTTLSPSWVYTRATLKLAGVHEAFATVRDTVPLVLTFSNRFHRIKIVRWYDDEGAPPLREKSLNALNGADTLVYRSGPNPSTSGFIVALVDEAGIERKTSISIRVLDDDPAVKLSASALSISFGETLTLTGSGQDLGRIVKWEWAIGKGSAFVVGGRPDTSFKVEILPGRGEPLACFLRATDEDGNTAVAETKFDVIPWKALASMRTERANFTATVMNGKIYALGGRTNSNTVKIAKTEIYDPITDTWETKADMKRPRSDHEAVIIGKEIMVVGGMSAEKALIVETEFYNPETDTWRVGPSLDVPRRNLGLAKLGSRVFAMEGFGGGEGGNQNLEEYDSASNTWSNLPLPGVQARFGFSTAVIGGKVYTLGGRTKASYTVWTGYLSRPLYRYDFTANTTTEGPTLEYIPFLRATAVHDNHLLMAGGNVLTTDRPVVNDRFEEMNPVDGTYRTLSTIRPGREGACLAILDGRAYLLGGATPSHTASLQVFAMPLDSVLANP